MLKKIECFIQPFKLEEVKDTLIDAGVEGISDAKGFGKQRGFLKGEILVDTNLTRSISFQFKASSSDFLMPV